MLTTASVKNHPIHPMLVPLPIGLWVFSFVCQIIALFAVNPVWHTVAFYAAGGGVIGALMAAIPWLIDLLSLKDHHVRGYGIKHMIANLTAVAVWAIVFYLMMPERADYTPALVLSLVGIVIISYSGWLGGDMVYDHGVGVKTSHSASSKVSKESHPKS